ncbi:MAG TPA: NAD(P)/FAD-dependent oxidoreductase [Pseudonocardiaceae bacterium]|nr:NAD(P)/FAD-dependent oxidoreductase [Pseudonocardiaceae bacterium]
MDVRPHVEVAIIGSGFAGLAMAIQLTRRGTTDFVVLERAGDVGGAWRDNTYPGCACDVPSTLYSFSFAANPNWTQSFSPQREIHHYLRDCASRFGLHRHLRLRHEVLEARWDEDRARWSIKTSRGRLTAAVLVSATGQLSEPVVPQLPGIERFTGTALHTTRWDHSVDLAGTRVAVIGTGASAVQLIPTIADHVAALHVFQRTAAWVLPQHNRVRGDVEHWALHTFPWLQRAVRAALYWGRECALIGFTHPRIMQAVALLARLHLRRQVPNTALRAALTPAYAMGCKRVVRSSTFYPTLSREHVELVTEEIREVREDSVITADGTERQVDILVFGTGFRAAEMPMARLIRGRGGRLLVDEWRHGGAQAYLGTAVAGFPNLFLLTGPNSALAHNSVVLGIETQVHYVLDALRVMASHELAAVEVQPQAQQAFVRAVRARMSGTVWVTGGCRSWFLDHAGRNTTTWPWFTGRLRRLTRRFDLENYDLRFPAPDQPSTHELSTAAW